MTFKVRKFMKRFNGSAIYNKPAKTLTPKDIKEICSGSKIAEGETPEKLIHNARSEQSQP